MKAKEEKNLLYFAPTATSRFVIKQFLIYKRRVNKKINILITKNTQFKQRKCLAIFSRVVKNFGQ